MNKRQKIMVYRVMAVFVASVFLAACQPSADTKSEHKATTKSADAFIADVNQRYLDMNREMNAAQWAYVTYINEDTALIAAKTYERYMEFEKGVLAEAREFKQSPMSASTAKAYTNLTLGKTLLPPDTAAERAELAQLGTSMEGVYGAGKYCKTINGKQDCRDLNQLSDVLVKSRTYDELLDAWTGWRTVSPAYKNDYARFIEIANAGAQAYGFSDLGASWKSGYDMPSADFEKDVERLWSQVEPLYQSLHCKVRTDLAKHYGVDKVPLDKPIPAHLLGNMWSQEWGNIYDLVTPYPGVGDLDVTAALVKSKKDPVAITKTAEQFFTSLGLRELPQSFWEKSMLTKPRDREVVCHASAWNMDAKDDVRIKECIEPTEAEFTTIHHELGHIYYYLAYNDKPYLFQNGANDGFHEAIGDTIVLSMTPDYLKQIGLIDKVEKNQQAVINQQMKMALDKVAFLPFGKIIDQWRWQVFSGKVKPEQYNQAWWQLVNQYQGIQSPVPRTETDFDAGAKYHIAANVPYTRYFIAHILQFQFHKALCDAAGFNGPLHECSIYNSKEAGAKLQAMLAAGASKPWQDVLEESIGTREMDASAILDYFAPLKTWLDEQNKGQACGW
ncbi:M2 family metallopeptidase [Cellvibrio sp. UBA7661]|uniref:M2 family metallopeptidase n=1 Tax=Cellvibrio sp. UBA7661 TaxID=1946311 RepID=UPI002F357A6D